MTQPLSFDALRGGIERAMTAVMELHAPALAEVGPETTQVYDGIQQLLLGGKRLRALFFYAGYLAGPASHPEAALRASAAMEFFQAAALLHDDVMDHSDIRRGQPTLHRALASSHHEQAWQGNAEDFGAAGAILAGNLCLVWCDSAFATSGLTADERDRARGTFDEMRTQLMGGQFLDVLLSHRGWDDLSVDEQLAQAQRVAVFKSALYTVAHPLLIGARASGADERTERALIHYGQSIGEAFQLRDDLLGVFGDPELTGKPAGDDLAEGKRTALIAWGLHLTDDEGRDVVAGALGQPHLDHTTVEHVRAHLRACGAVDRVEDRIRTLHDDAIVAIADLHEVDPVVWQLLTDLAHQCVRRTA